MNGLNFDYTINIGVWFGGLIGLAIIEYALACVVLWGLPAGGVKHASEIDSHHRGKGTDVRESHITRDKIDVSVSISALTDVERLMTSWFAGEKSQFDVEETRERAPQG